MEIVINMVSKCLISRAKDDVKNGILDKILNERIDSWDLENRS